MKIPPVFRLATLNDLEQLVSLRVLMQKDVRGIQVDEVDAQYLAAVRKYFVESFQGGSYYSVVAESEGQLVSANGLVIYRKPPSLGGGTGYMGYVSNVYTLPEWRGRGIATELMKALVQKARLLGIDKLQLGATELGQGVYGRVGFKPVGIPAFELKLE